ncbi:MerR family transcriptional regulator [Gracilibacillus halophilus YIM-C55.5]|uniref:MerR family transcriptional regulator n=1 Tax=Gracilibacillus halophilus YIM-C55.5 TaxID=1308866 RepID=N4WN80_9BACI|nr:MerR family transcriptional regulator [Gracilibacillus halophilus]ENH97562.1 MerR family transcriptional regulator [Gracilibacillus halophilus YIM-C55.5]
MKINPHIHLTTGQFAELMNIKKDTLFYYDKMKIFSPEIIAPNGYRYYSIYQADVFNVIGILKELDIPLKKIKSYLDNRSPEKLLHLLEQEAAALTTKINRLYNMRQFIHDKINVTKEAIESFTSEIIIQHKVEDEYLLTTNTKPLTNEMNVYDSIQLHYKYLEKHDLIGSASEGWMILAENVINKDNLKYDYLYTKVHDSHYANQILPKGTYLVAYHKEGYSNISETYNRFVQYAKNNGFVLKGYFYEDILLDELSVKGFEQYIIKLSVQVVESKNY